MTLIRTAAGIVHAIAPHWLYKLMHRENLGRSLRIGPEDRVCITFADNLRVWSLEGRLKATWTHIPHEVGGGAGRGSEARYAVAKALGLIAGSGDYVFVAPDGPGGWIEAKRPKDGKSAAGRLNPAQVMFRDWCALAGVRYEVMHSPEEGEAILKKWGMLDG